MWSKLLYRTVVGVLLTVSSFCALATEGLYLEGFGAISRGMGGTAAAHYVGPASMMVNPATMDLSDATGEVLLGFDLITTDISALSVSTGESVSSSTRSNNRGPYIAPSLLLLLNFPTGLLA